MTVTDLAGLFEYARSRTQQLIDAVASLPDPQQALGWRPGPGRAHVAWQLMHLGATDDRHLNVRMKGREAHSPDLVRRFAGGSTPDDDIPPLADIVKYVTDRRADMLAHLRSLTDADLKGKPNDAAPMVYEEWFRLLAWHEGHHHGQAHLTLNLYRATQTAAAAKPGQ
ncbi:Uncharacterized protein OS=Pirellula staleyi (strain ATCC 27377 / DSM 6068 / ICPB 4128) GN=Psta_3298 PE=4 SV=1: DinB_2 [Gemmataceae bacterium]|nr:Uncharacterized protein OS=Pirellula staleyi (strain ATCC 27377 / DSM 6068 / ICPB 4128) GN=Psta_3298 PE=4 SV=1: DinB_2 [Gemmataceae bacterium]VTU00039.1 Uncharacterized protein OS=Pirellula staleyi (strain ATCC 27377 / DSM 6068 / ICPB 4128) GN=Psta_3298 PE=4 SV=1: DinB_2 [Gemmataceae bacterium]